MFFVMKNYNIFIVFLYIKHQNIISIHFIYYQNNILVIFENED